MSPTYYEAKELINGRPDGGQGAGEDNSFELSLQAGPVFGRRRTFKPGHAWRGQVPVLGRRAGPRGAREQAAEALLALELRLERLSGRLDWLECELAALGQPHQGQPAERAPSAWTGALWLAWPLVLHLWLLRAPQAGSAR